MIATPHNRAGEIALGIYEDVLRRVHGDALVRAAVAREGDRLRVGEHVLDLGDFRRVFVCGAGKASAGMAEPLVALLSDRLDGGLVVTKDGHGLPLGPVEVVEAGHPVPDERSLEAGERMRRLAEGTGEVDLVLFVLSGGASALMEALAEGVTLDDLRQTNQRLLASGAAIHTMNAIRSRLSRLKGGGLGGAFAPARVLCLVISDVPGNDLAVIGSGPFVSSDPQHVRRAVDHGFLDALPSRVRQTIDAPANMTQAGEVPHVIVGELRTALQAARASVEAQGLHAVVAEGDFIQGEARDVGRRCLLLAERLGVSRDLTEVEMTLPTELRLLLQRHRNAWIQGGESTVTVRGTGRGGRCQEMACAAAGAIAGRDDLAFLAAGTDGTDGPTDAAGALVDGGSVVRAMAQGWSVERALETNDSYRFHQAAGTLIKTGPTQSNVNDLMILVQA